ncbi:MAG: hypothetical protein HY961_06620 [Ignavibacteriae bacterium]|nr:hypothetical protein [Ignavibacteriota bacterium]
MKRMAVCVFVSAMLASSLALGQEQKSEKAEPMKAKPMKSEAMKSEAMMSEKASTLHGYVVDQMCAKTMIKKGNPMERAAKHTKECAQEEACAASGYGLLYGDGKWLKFDEKGDKLAAAMFEKSKKDKDFMADVSGEIKGDKLMVASLKESEMSTDQMKPMKKDESQEHHDKK